MITEDFLERVNKARKNGKKIGLVQGSWDLFHLGHLKYIIEAKKLCDFLVVGMDSDMKIKKRKGPSRPIIPENERNEFLELLPFVDEVVVKDVNEPKWNLIKSIVPDVLIIIKDNYSASDIIKLEEICGKVTVLPRQSEGSTSDLIRNVLISSRNEQAREVNSKVLDTIEEMKKRLNYSEYSSFIVKKLFENLKYSTDSVCPVCVACYWNNEWFYGTNQIDFSISKFDIENRTELFYDTTEHAEINLLKKLGDVSVLNTPIYSTLFPCDKCMKVLIDKGVKEIYYLEDHPNRNWSKRSHDIALKNGVKTVCLLPMEKEEIVSPSVLNDSSYKFIYPQNARYQSQLDIMLDLEKKGQDPLDPDIINQEILYYTNYWYISPNRFPYNGVEQQYLIVSRYPIYRIEDVSEQMWQDLQNIWLDLKEKFDISGGALCFRFGDPSLSGASLTRLHCHLIMPKEEEKIKFNIGGSRVLKPDLKLLD